MRARARLSLSLFLVASRRASSSGATRTKRRTGERDSFLLSWDVIAKCDDIFVSRICFAEIEFEMMCEILARSEYRDEKVD